MKTLTRKQTLALIASKPDPGWTTRPAPGGKPITLGEYGYAEQYEYRGVPQFRLEVCRNPPKCTAYDLRT